MSMFFLIKPADAALIALILNYCYPFKAINIDRFDLGIEGRSI